MCSLSAYLGPSVMLCDMLPQALVGDPGASPQDRNIITGKDTRGFGIGWYAPDGSPAFYGRALPVYLDANLTGLARSMSSGLWLFHTTEAGPAEGARHAVMQPFQAGDFMFALEGFIENFRLGVCPLLRQFIAPDIEAGIETTSAAEHLFAVLRHLLSDDPGLPLAEALSELFSLLEDWLEENRTALLNVIISDGEGLCAARHAINCACAPLYFTTDDEAFPQGQLIASAPLTASAFWQPVPEHHILILDPVEPPQLLRL